MSNALLNERFGETVDHLDDRFAPYVEANTEPAKRLAFALLAAVGAECHDHTLSNEAIDLGRVAHEGISAQAVGKLAVNYSESGEPTNVSYAVQVTPEESVRGLRSWSILSGDMFTSSCSLASVSKTEAGLALMAQATGYNYRPVEKGFNDPADIAVAA